MASYIENSLGQNERIVYKAQVSWLSQFGRLVFGALFALLIREIPIIGIIRHIVYYCGCAECHDNGACIDQ